MVRCRHCDWNHSPISRHIYIAVQAGKTACDAKHITQLLRPGIRANCVSPWYIETPLAAPVLKDPAYLAEVLGHTPMGRVGQPDVRVPTCIPERLQSCRFVYAMKCRSHKVRILAGCLLPCSPWAYVRVNLGRRRKLGRWLPSSVRQRLDTLQDRTSA